MLVINESMFVWHWWNDSDWEKSKYSENYFSVSLSITNYAWTGTGLNLDLCSERLATSCVSRGITV